MNSSIVDPSRNPAWGYQIKGNEVVYAPLYQATSNIDNFPQSIAATDPRALSDLILNPDNNPGKISGCFDNAVSASKPTNDKADIKSAIAEELFSAVEQNDSAKLQKLINSTNDMNIKNRKGETLLHVAIEHNAIESTRLLITSRIGVFVKNQNGKTPLFYAIDQGNIAFMELFRLHFDHPNYAEYNGRMLYDAVGNDRQCIDFLLALKHINVNYEDENGYTPVNIAARWHPDCVLKLLSDSRVDPGISNKYGNNILASAVISGSLQCVSFLMMVLSHQEITATDIYGNSLLHKVLASDNVKMLNLLLHSEILDINAQNNKGYTPLRLAVCLDAKECFARLLCQEGIDPHIKDFRGHNVLHMAIWNKSYYLSKEDNFYNQVWFTSRLLEAGFDHVGQNGHKNNILHLAVKRGNAELIDIMSSHGISFNDCITLDDKGRPPIECAIYQADKACLMAMRELPNFDINLQHKDGCTALHYAARYSRNNFIRLLLKWGGNPYIEDKNGHTAADIFNFSSRVLFSFTFKDELRKYCPQYRE